MGTKFLKYITLALICFLSLSLSAKALVVKSIKIVGNETFTEKRLKKILFTTENKWYSGIFSDTPYFKEEILKNDLERLKVFYQSKGFYNPDLKAEINITNNNEANIKITIIAGKRYILEKVIFDGIRRFYEQDITKNLDIELNKPIDFIKVKGWEKNIKFFYACNGFPFANVSTNYDIPETTNLIALKISIEENKKAYFGSTSEWGYDISKPEIVHREFSYKIGDIYSECKLFSTRKNLLETQLFEVVDIRPESLENKDDTINIKISLIEKKSRYTSLNTSFATNVNYDLTMDITGEVGDRNLFGTGRGLSLKAISQFELLTQFQNLKNRFVLGYYTPFLFQKRIPSKGEIYFDPGNKSESEQYRLQRVGATIGFRYPVDSLTFHQVNLNYEQIDIYGITDPELIEGIKVQNGIRIKRAINYTFNRDKRNNLFYPNSGSSFQLTTEYAGFGGDENYLLLKTEWARYMKTVDDITYANRIMVAGIGNLYHGEDVLPHNRLFLGGGGSIRGFAEKGLGPKDSQGLPLGGKALFLTNFELRKILFWKISGTAFLDVGNLWGEFESVTPSQLRITGGWGVAFLSPVGPIRFDYAYHIRKLDADSKPRWHLGIFYAF